MEKYKVCGSSVVPANTNLCSKNDTHDGCPVVFEKAPRLKAAVAFVLVNAVVIVATTTVVFVLAVIFALPELKLIILPTSVV